MSLREQKQDWEELANLDPFWAIFTRPEGKHGKWDIGEFFATGDRDVAEVMETATELGYPRGRQCALDFGCGVGRLTRALSKHFEQCYGVDIAETMVAKAKELNSSVPNCTFIVNSEENLHIFPQDQFDMIYTKWVLQHLPSKRSIMSYIAEFIRILKEGGLVVFQFRTYLPYRTRLQAGRRLYGLFRRLGLREKVIYERLGISPMRMISVPEHEILTFLRSMGGHVVKIEKYSIPSGRGAIFYVTK